MDNESKFGLDRASKYYPICMNYFIFCHGTLELMSRGVYKTLNKATSEINCESSEFITEALKANLIPTKLIRPISLRRKSMNGGYIDVSSSNLSNEILNNLAGFQDYYAQGLTSAILNTYEVADDSLKFNKESEIWNFLYHCRNAAAHDQKFHITKSGKKRFPAKWRGIEISETDNGRGLIDNGKNGGLLDPGDPIQLIIDLSEIDCG